MAAIGPLIVVLLAAAPGRSKADCVRIERGLSRALEMAQFEKEPEGTVGKVFADSGTARQSCPDAEGLAYLHARSAELGGGALVGRLLPAGVAELRKITADAARQFPSSARILTVHARVSRDEAVARRAVAAEPEYVPARVALADILVDRGDWRAAERVLGEGRGLDGTSDGLLVRARVQLAKGDARGALATAKRVLTGRKPELLEPDAGDPRPLLGARAVEKQARARRGANGPVRP